MGRELTYTSGNKERTLNVKFYIFTAIRLRKLSKRNKWSYGWQRVFFPSKDYIEEKNSMNFVRWIINQLKSTGIEVKNTNQYNACALYMNTHDLNKLHKYMSPMIWLNYSPTTCDELKNGEIGVEMSEVIAREHR